MLTKLDKLKKELEKVENQLEKVRGCSSRNDGWQTMRLAKKQRSWDILGEKRTQLRWQIDELEQELASESICDCGDTNDADCFDAMKTEQKLLCNSPFVWRSTPVYCMECFYKYRSVHWEKENKHCCFLIECPKCEKITEHNKIYHKCQCGDNYCDEYGCVNQKMKFGNEDDSLCGQ